VFLGRAWNIVSFDTYVASLKSTYRCIGGKGIDENIIERDILGANEEVGPAGRVELSDTFDTDTSGIIGQEQNWAVVRIGRVLKLGQ